MKLSIIVEGRRPPDYVKLFHGTSNPGVLNSLSLIPHAPMKMANRPIRNQNSYLSNPKLRKKAIFLTPYIELALYYAGLNGFVVEVLANNNSTQLVKDEEHFPLGEIPGWLPVMGYLLMKIGLIFGCGLIKRFLNQTKKIEKYSWTDI